MLKIKKILLFVWESLQALVISLLIVLPIRYFIIQPFFVYGASMEPAFQNADYLIVDEISYRFKPPKRGDVIVFKYPLDPKQYFIKRIIALPGETIEIKSGKIWIYNESKPSGFKFDESFYLNYYGTTEGDLKTTLDKESYFLLGDNRPLSSDSRRFGPVSKKYIVGKVWLRAFPLGKFTTY